MIFSPEYTVSFSDRFAIPDKRDPGYGDVEPGLFADDVHGEVALAGHDLEPRFLHGVGKKKFSVKPDDGFIVFLFFLLSGRFP